MWTSMRMCQADNFLGPAVRMDSIRGLLLDATGSMGAYSKLVP